MQLLFNSAKREKKLTVVILFHMVFLRVFPLMDGSNPEKAIKKMSIMNPLIDLNASMKVAPKREKEKV